MEYPCSGAGADSRKGLDPLVEGGWRGDRGLDDEAEADLCFHDCEYDWCATAGRVERRPTVL